MQNQLLQIFPTTYYHITHPSTSTVLSLTTSPSSTCPSPEIQLCPMIPQQLGQIWMLVQVSPELYPNMYQIVHTVSTLVLTSKKDHTTVQFGKWKSNQLFFLQRLGSKDQANQFYIKTGKNSNTYLVALMDGKQGCVRVKDVQGVPGRECVWRVGVATTNDLLNASCYIQYAFSGMVLDVPKASSSPNTTICQYPCNNRLNQRWNILKPTSPCSPCSPNLYLLQNMKSKLYVSTHTIPPRTGTKIVQSPLCPGENRHQLWQLQLQGKNVYQIRSALDPRLFLCVLGDTLAQCADIGVTNDDAECFWKVFGYLPA